jgi:hypothetical protein
MLLVLRKQQQLPDLCLVATGHKLPCDAGCKDHPYLAAVAPAMSTLRLELRLACYNKGMAAVAAVLGFGPGLTTPAVAGAALKQISQDGTVERSEVYSG